MAWRDTLIELRDELAEARARRLQRAEADEEILRQVRQQMADLSGSLGIGQLLTDINATLLEGRGEVETIVSWDQESDDRDSEPDLDEGSGKADRRADRSADNEDDDEDDEDAITNLLSWDEDGDREIAVEIILDEEGVSLQVNGVEIRPEREALEQALVEAFRDELEL